MTARNSILNVLLVCTFGLSQLAFSCGGGASFFSGSPGFGGGGTGQSSGPNPTPVPQVIERGPPFTAEDIAEPVDIGDVETEAPEPIDVGPMPTPTPTPPPYI